MPTIIITALLGIAAGALAIYLVMLRKNHERDRCCVELQTRNEQMGLQIENLKHDHEQELSRLKDSQQQLLQQYKDSQQELVTRQMQLFKEQVGHTSEEVLRKRQEQLAQANTQSLNEIVNPLQDELKRMRDMVEKADREHADNMARLDTAIRLSQKNAESIGQKADRLAQALTGENKTQGNFGELRLKQLLDDMGFEEGLQYDQQFTMVDEKGNTITNSQGQRLQPDVILHFPDKRDIIIDSKVSLKAFEDYHNTTDETAKKEALDRHVASMRQHVKELAAKEYSKYLTRNNLDFVIMYVFSESALQLALSASPNLYREAYDQHVIICGSNNLYALLRVLETSWKQMQQVQNQREIVNMANTIIERVQIFNERLNAVEECLNKTSNAMDSLRKTTASSGKSIITAARNLEKLGASQTKKHKALPTGTEDEETDDDQLKIEG